MTRFNRFKFFLWYFGHFKVAMIGYLKPQLIALTDHEIVVCLPLNRRSRNHLHSMYFGALAVGADIAGGLHGFYHAQQAQCKISLAFKSFQAEFIKRPESAVYFVSTMGNEIQLMIQESKQSGERLNKLIPVNAYTNYPAQPEQIAQFTLELSIKALIKAEAKSSP